MGVVHPTAAVGDYRDDHHHGTGWPVVPGVVVVADSRSPLGSLTQARGAMTLRTLVAWLAKVNVLRIAPLSMAAHFMGKVRGIVQSCKWYEESLDRIFTKWYTFTVR